MHESLNLCPCLRTYNKDNNQLYLDINCNPIGNIKEENSERIFIYPQPAHEMASFIFKNPNNYKSELLIFNSFTKKFRNIKQPIISCK